MARQAVLTFTKLKDEPFFIQCAESLRGPRNNPIQAATITSIDTIRLERQVSVALDTWEEAVAYAGFANLQVLDDGTFTDAMIAGTVTADRDASPAPGEAYRIVAECTIEFVAAFGSSSTGKVFRAPARIVAGSITAPSS